MIERTLTIRIVSPEERPDDISIIEVTGTLNDPETEPRLEAFRDPIDIMKLLVVVDLLLSLMGEEDTPKRNSGKWN